MIKLIGTSDSIDRKRIYYDYFPRQKRNYFLLIDHFQDDPFICKMEEYIVGEFVKLNLSELPLKHLDNLLSEFFVKLNWQIYSGFAQRPDLERGFSLAFLIFDNNKFYFVKFGRFSAGKIIKDQLEKIDEWVNPAVLSYDKMGLLGSIDTDITVKIHKIEMEDESRFLIINSKEALDLEKKGIHQLSLIEHINALSQSAEFCYILLENSHPKALCHRYWVRKQRVNRTAIILMVVIILSSVYAFWGANIIDDLLARFKFKSEEFTRNELKEQFILLQEQAEELLTEISQEDIALIPQQKLIMEKEWELNFRHSIETNPVFDFKNIYASGNFDVYAIDKESHEKVWQRHFQEKVEVIRVVDANRLIVGLGNSEIHCLNRLNGECQWQKKIDMSELSDNCMNLDQISLNQYRQLDESIFLIRRDRSIALGLIRNGDITAEFETGEIINSISSYDLLDKCIYITAGNKLLKVNIKVIL